MVKDGEDKHGLQTTNLKNSGWTFQDVSANREIAQNPYLTPEGFKLFHKPFTIALPFLHLPIQTFQAVLKSFTNWFIVF